MRNDRKRYAFAAAAFTVALGGAALGGVVARAQVAAPTVTIRMTEFRLTASARLHAGRVTLAAVNRGKIPHALAIKGPGASARTAVLGPGKSARLTVTLRNGSYTLWCPVGTHASLGMKLSATVGAGGGTSGGGTTGGTGGTTPPPTTGTDGAEWG